MIATASPFSGKQKTPPDNRWGVRVHSCGCSCRIPRRSADALHRFDSEPGRRANVCPVRYLFSCCQDYTPTRHNVQIPKISQAALLTSVLALLVLIAAIVWPALRR